MIVYMCCSLCRIPYMPFLWGERLAESFWCQITEECAAGFVYLSVGPGRDKGKGVIWIKGVRSEFFSPIMILLPYLAHFALAFSFALTHSCQVSKILSLLCDYSLLWSISPSHHFFPSLKSVTTTFPLFLQRVYDWLTPCSLCLSRVAGATVFWNAGSGVDCRVLNEKHTLPR